MARVYRQVDGPRVIFTSNYGEAGAVDRYGPDVGLPLAYSGHNAFAEWGPPPDWPAAVVVVGLGKGELAAVDLCSGTRRPWSQMWSSLGHLN